MVQTPLYIASQDMDMEQLLNYYFSNTMLITICKNGNARFC